MLDHTGQPIRWGGAPPNSRIILVTNRLQRRQSGSQMITYITLKTGAEPSGSACSQIPPLVRQASAKYGVEESLILAIMQTESSFNRMRSAALMRWD